MSVRAQRCQSHYISTTPRILTELSAGRLCHPNQLHGHVKAACVLTAASLPVTGNLTLTPDFCLPTRCETFALLRGYLPTTGRVIDFSGQPIDQRCATSQQSKGLTSPRFAASQFTTLGFLFTCVRSDPLCPVPQTLKILTNCADPFCQLISTRSKI